MAEADIFDRDIGELETDLAGMRQAQAVAGAMFADAAGTLSPPDPAAVIAEAGRLAAETAARGKIEAGLARLVGSLANDIAIEKASFDTREVPTRWEAWLGRLSKASMRRRIEARIRDPAPLQRLLELLRRADRLAGLLDAERVLLLAGRDKGEADLIAFHAGRDAAIAKLSGDAETPLSDMEAIRRVETFTALAQAFVAELNDRLEACNILTHKLSADTEDLLLLYRILFDSLRRRGDAGPLPDHFPHLAAAMARFAAGTLMLHGLDARRGRADGEFAKRFAGDVSDEQTL